MQELPQKPYFPENDCMCFNIHEYIFSKIWQIVFSPFSKFFQIIEEKAAII